MSEPVAVFPMFNTASVQIMECNDEYVCYLDLLGGWHRAKIYLNIHRAYFLYCGRFRIHLDECLKI